MKIWTTHSSLLSKLPAGIDPSTIQSNPNLSDVSGISCMAPEIDRIYLTFNLQQVQILSTFDKSVLMYLSYGNIGCGVSSSGDTKLDRFWPTMSRFKENVNFQQQSI